jgi:hypothetical protein
VQQKLKVELAHHATADLTTGKISVPIGDITINMPYDDFFELVSQMQDIALSFATITEVQTYACESCGSINDVIQKLNEEN